MRVITAAAVVWAGLVSVSCDLDTSKVKTQNKNSERNGFPSFAVEPFNYVSVDTAVSLYVTDIDCIDKMNQSNAANKGVIDALNEQDNAKPLALAMSADIYAKTIFYDCNVLEQFASDGAEEVEDTDAHTLYHAGQVEENVFEGTRFVEWRELKDSNGTIPRTNDEADNVIGTMTNLYGQDNHPSYTQVSLNKNGNMRQVGTLMEGKDGGKLAAIWSGFIVEHKSGTDKEHLLSMRRLHKHEDGDKILLLLAHYKADGAALLEAECDIEDGEDYNKSCADAEYEISYYDKAADEVEEGDDNVPAGFKKTKEDFLTNVNSNWAHGNYLADKLDPSEPFFAGTTGTIATKREEFFTANLPTPTATE